MSFESFSEESYDDKGETVRVITIDSLRNAFLQIDASGDIHDVQLMAGSPRLRCFRPRSLLDRSLIILFGA